jgi:hypothetical protein
MTRFSVTSCASSDTVVVVVVGRSPFCPAGFS